MFAKDKYKVIKIVRQKLELKKCKRRCRKWADVNHVKRTLGKTLHDSKGLDFGSGNDRLTDQVKEYVLYCFFHCFVSK